jgi:hypothetical protein
MQLRERRTGIAYGDLATYSRTVNLKNNQTRPPEWINVELGVNCSVRQFALK